APGAHPSSQDSPEDRMNVNDGTPAPTAAEESEARQPLETEAAASAQVEETAQAPESDATASPETPADDPTPSDAAATGAPAEADAGETAEERLRRVEEEGVIAADYLEELLDIADLDGDMDIDVDGDRASVEIRGADELARLNRPKGELLDALQELARLAVQT